MGRKKHIMLNRDKSDRRRSGVKVQVAWIAINPNP